MADPTLAHYGSRRGAACGATGDTWFSDPALFLEVRPELRCEACLTRAQAALSGGPTLAEMVERLRTCADVAPLPVVADALTEIDRRLTALEELRHLPTCGTAYRGCDPACPFDAKWRAEGAYG
mgnify:CR=1 FL=1